MTPALAITGLQALAKLFEALAPTVQQALAVANSDDAAEIKAALDDLQAKVDVQHAETQALLRG
jgi:hypothetical protein